MRNGGDYKFTNTAQPGTAGANGGNYGKIPAYWGRNRDEFGNLLPQQSYQQPQQVPSYQQPQVPAPVHYGYDAAATAAVTYVAVDQTRKYRTYRKFVGPEYASVKGFFIWKSQFYPLLRQQPRVNVPRGLLFTGIGVVLFALAYIPHLSLVFLPLFLASLVYALLQFRHQTPPAADLQALYNWHRAFAINQGIPPLTYAETRRNSNDRLPDMGTR
jgi:hypothetical protein